MRRCENCLEIRFWDFGRAFLFDSAKYTSEHHQKDLDIAEKIGFPDEIL